MKTIFQNFSLLIFTLLIITSCGCEEVKTEKKPVNKIILLDLSDRILLPGQLDLLVVGAGNSRDPGPVRLRQEAKRGARRRRRQRDRRTDRAASAVACVF